MKMHHYRLFAIFKAATLARGPADQCVQFELSAGNFGNMLDDAAPVCSSATHPAYTRALRDCTPSDDRCDGAASDYSFVLWSVSARKPCVLLDSYWEDVLYRAEATNAMAYIVDLLVRSLFLNSDATRVAMRFESYVE